MALTRLNNNAIGETLSVAKGGTGVTTSADLANTGNLVKITSGTISSASSLTLDDVFSSTYSHYLFNYSFDFGSVTDKDLRLRFRYDTNERSTSYEARADYLNPGVNSGYIQNTTAGTFYDVFDNVDEDIKGHIWFYDMHSSKHSFVEWWGYGDDNNNMKRIDGFGSRDDDTEYDGFIFYEGGLSTNFSGNYELYGYKK